MTKYYTDEKNAQVVLSLLKQHGIKKIVASPGTTNMAIVASVQHDPYFEVYSSVDERSAAYIACGLAAESREPVVLSCTGATASRNYMPGLTEAFYRKLPILAVTSMQSFHKVGHLLPQTLDRSSMPNDVFKSTYELPSTKDAEDVWNTEITVNKAVLDLTRNGGGPVHINLATTYDRGYSTKELPQYRCIQRYMQADELPVLPKGKIAIFVGAHLPMSAQLIEAIDLFCASNDAIVLCDHSSGYNGKYKVLYSLIGGQLQGDKENLKPDLMIHMGEVSGDYYTLGIAPRNVWRLSEDGELRDAFKVLSNVFEMKEEFFFNAYVVEGGVVKDNYLKACLTRRESIKNKLPELPFSNVWMAGQLAGKLPEDSVLHLSILNSLRSWNFFELPNSITSFSNVGGFGIDGCMSSLIGASLANPNKLYFGVIGDLAFFYDMNVLGNRHVGNNVRILMINNGKGTEFRNYGHVASQFGESADEYIAASGHYGNKSNKLVKDYAENLGFNYLSASNKEEFALQVDIFTNQQLTDMPILFEVFTDSKLESEALELMRSIEVTSTAKVKGAVRNILGDSGTKLVKGILGKNNK